MQHNSFEGETKVLTDHGYVAIKDIAVGDQVAAIDEKTGNKVWRKVTEIFSKPSNKMVDLELEDASGQRTKVKTTLEHPFHIEKWDGKVETMVADLSPIPNVDPSRLFPSDEQTRFGDWVKAGALKVGDKVSTLGSVPDGVANDNQFGPRVAANNNTPLTITDIVRDNAATRVYNFEVASGPDEITHNYFVGDNQAWVHNSEAWRIAKKLRDRGYLPIPGDQIKTPCGCRKNYMKGKITVSIDCNDPPYEEWPHIDVKRPGKPKIRIPWTSLK
jgi:hypothetical protein